MTIDEARAALIELERGPETRTQSFGPQQWVDNFRRGDDALRTRSHEVAWALVHEGTADERRYALAFWDAVSPPEGVSDALAELYLSESPSDPGLRSSLGLYTGHRFSDEVGQRLAARFSADPDGEAALAVNAVRYDPHGAAWDALIRLVLKTDDATGLFRLFGAAYQAGRSDDFFAALRGKPPETLKEVAASVPLKLRARFGQVTGVSYP